MTYSNELLGGDDGLLKYAVITSFLCLQRNLIKQA